MIKYLIALLAIVLCQFAEGQQTAVLKLSVDDSGGNPVSEGMVTLAGQQDNKSIRYGFVEKGVVVFKGLEKGPYELQLASPGYRDTVLQLNLEGDRDLRLILTIRQMQLKEVSIVGYKDAFTFSNGNIKAQIDNTILSTMPDVVEVMAKLPGVRVSNDRESLTILGKGEPLIYIGNQRVSLNDLSLLSVNDIKQIEVINNPSSKYESEGRAVILITRKVAKENGYRVDVTETASQKRLFENRFGVNASAKQGRNEWKATLQYNHINRWEGLAGSIQADANQYHSGFDGTSIGLRRQAILGLGFYRQLNDGDYLSINVGGRMQDEVPEIQTNSFVDTNTNSRRFDTRASNWHSRPYLNANVNYQKSLKNKAGKLFFGGQTAYYSRHIRNEIYNNPQSTQFALSEVRRQDFDILVYVGRVDYEVELFERFHLESGVMVNLADSKTDFTVDSTWNSTVYRVHYNYREANEAGYLQLSGKQRRYDWNLGLRVEYTDLNGGLNNSIPLIERHFVYLLPKAGIIIPIDSQRTVSLYYANSVRRPDYANLNQTTNYITPFLERSNNIYINPSQTQEVTLNYQTQRYILSANLYHIQQPMYFITEADPATRRVRMINRNLESEQGGGLSLTVPYTYNRFSSNNILNANINRINDQQAVQLTTRPFYYVYSGNQVKLKNNMTFMFSGWYTSRKYEGIFQHNSQFAVDLSLSKKFKGGLTCTINAFDIFRSLNYRESFKAAGVYSDVIYFENVREFSVSLRYSIGQIKNPRFRSKEVNDNGNRLN